MKHNFQLKDGIILTVLVAVFLGIIFIPRTFTGHDFAFQIVAACLGAIITMFITKMLLKNQSESEEDKEKNIKIYESKIKVYSSFISKMWNTLEDEEVTEDELRQLRSTIFNELIFYVSPDRVNALKTCVDAIFLEKDKMERNESNIGVLSKEYMRQYANITKILRADLNGNSTKGDTIAENAEQIQKLWTSFKIKPTEDAPQIQSNIGLAKKEEVMQDCTQTELYTANKYDGQFWHFNMWGYNQLRALKNGKFELSLVEYNGEDWRTNLIRQVKPGDIVFLFRRGGWGYIGAYRVMGHRIFDFNGNNEEIVLNGKTDVISPIPEQDIKEYDYYNSMDDGADLCSNLIVKQLAYYDNGVSYPGGVYRRTISRYDYGYGMILLSRLLATVNDTENFGRLHESDGIAKPMTCDIEEFKELTNSLNIYPAEKDNNGNWK